MSVLIVAELSKGSYRKASLETISYGSQVAAMLNTTATVLAIGQADAGHLAQAGNYGSQKVIHVDHPVFQTPDSALYTRLISDIASRESSDLVLFTHDNLGRAVAPRLSATMRAGLVSGAIALPDLSYGFVVRKNVFSGKAFADIEIKTAKRILSLLPNSVPVVKTSGNALVEKFSEGLDSYRTSLTAQYTHTEKEGEIPLTEAELVVSAGRGMKGPENWGMIETLASTIGAATACSRPVSDIGWRPHHEHVGQTGLAIRPNLYIAVGISGAIQHLAGVNGSKVIVVINKDPEAPFFKAADYGIVGDAFEVVPKLIEAFKKFKSAN